MFSISCSDNSTSIRAADFFIALTTFCISYSSNVPSFLTILISLKSIFSDILITFFGFMSGVDMRALLAALSNPLLLLILTTLPLFKLFIISPLGTKRQNRRLLQTTTMSGFCLGFHILLKLLVLVT